MLRATVFVCVICLACDCVWDLGLHSLNKTFTDLFLKHDDTSRKSLQFLYLPCLLQHLRNWITGESNLGFKFRYIFTTSFRSKIDIEKETILHSLGRNSICVYLSELYVCVIIRILVSKTSKIRLRPCWRKMSMTSRQRTQDLRQGFKARLPVYLLRETFKTCLLKYYNRL